MSRTVSPSQEEVTAAIDEVLASQPGLGLSKLRDAILANHPWVLSENVHPFFFYMACIYRQLSLT